MGNELNIIEIKGKRVLTTLQLANSYGTDPKVINKNFERNRERFQEGKHYFSLTGDDLKEFKGMRQNDDTLKFVSVIYLWTEIGALHHAKSLGTDKAWEVFEMLEETYFRVKENHLSLPQTFADALRALAERVEQNERLQLENEGMKPKAEFFDAVAESKDAIEMAHAAKVLAIQGYGRNNLFEFLRNQSVLDKNNTPYQKYVDCGYFRVLEQKYNKPNGEIAINIKTLVYQKGLDFIRRLINNQQIA